MTSAIFYLFSLFHCESGLVDFFGAPMTRFHPTINLRLAVPDPNPNPTIDRKSYNTTNRARLWFKYCKSWAIIQNLRSNEVQVQAFLTQMSFCKIIASKSSLPTHWPGYIPYLLSNNPFVARISFLTSASATEGTLGAYMCDVINPVMSVMSRRVDVNRAFRGGGIDS